MIKNIEFTTDAKYQGKVKDSETLYLTPFSGGGGGGGTTLNKYTYQFVKSSAGIQRLNRIIANAKGRIYAWESNESSKYQLAYVYSTSVRFENINTSSSPLSITISAFELSATECNKNLYTIDSNGLSYSAYGGKGVNIVYFNDTEIT